MGEDSANCRSMADGRKDCASSLRRLDVERFAEKYGIRAGGGCFVVRISSGVSAIAVVSALRKIGADFERYTGCPAQAVGNDFNAWADMIAAQCAGGWSGSDGV